MLVSLVIILAVALVVMHFDNQRLARKWHIKDVDMERKLLNTTSDLNHIRKALIAAIAPDDPKYCFAQSSILVLVKRQCQIIKTKLEESHQETIAQMETECRDLRQRHKVLRSCILEAIGKDLNHGSIAKHRATNEGEYAGRGRSLLDSISEADGVQAETR